MAVYYNFRHLCSLQTHANDNDLQTSLTIVRRPTRYAALRCSCLYRWRRSRGSGGSEERPPKSWGKS